MLKYVLKCILRTVPRLFLITIRPSSSSSFRRATSSNSTLTVFAMGASR